MPRKKLPAYYASTESLALRLDEAWADYKNQALLMEKRQEALDFMIYVFDIKDISKKPDDLNKTLLYLMGLREKHKGSNPEYVPILTSGRYHLDTKARELQATVDTGEFGLDKESQQAYQNKELLDVNPKEKKKDQERAPIYPPLLKQKRAEFRLEIKDGLFHQFGKIFDSSKSIAHKKKKFVAFTLNWNGELSVFSHLGGQIDEKGRLLVHSSMNQGAPVLAAGEMQIENGKLISINTYSGHYKPSLYSVARFLEYVSDRNIDISLTKIYLERPPEGLLSYKKVYFRGDPFPWYEVSAKEVVFCVKDIINKNIASMDEFLIKNVKKQKNYKGGFASLFQGKKSKEQAPFTDPEIALAKDFKEVLLYLKDNMKNSSSVAETRDSLLVLESVIERYAAQCPKDGKMLKVVNQMQEHIINNRKKLAKLDEVTRTAELKSMF